MTEEADKKKVMKFLRRAQGSDTDWAWVADCFVEWLLEHPDSEAMNDFVTWIEPGYLDEEEPRVWDFFFGWDEEPFIKAWFENEEEADDFRRFLARRR